MRSKIFIVFMLLLSLFFLSGCGVSEESSSSNEEVSISYSTIEEAISLTDRTKDSMISEGAGKNGAKELVIDSKISDYSPEDSAFAVCYDACEALKTVPDNSNFGSVMFNFNTEYTANDGSKQSKPVVRIRYTTEQINNFDFSSDDYTGYKNIADVVKMDIN